MAAAWIGVFLKGVVVWHGGHLCSVPGVPFVPSVPSAGTVGQVGTLGSGVWMRRSTLDLLRPR